MRPEITAGLMRAFAEHRPPTPWKAWTVGPNFRYEQPQAGRYRQHHQLDAEIVGTDDPDADVEVIALLDGFHRALGLRRRTLLLNSLGDADVPPGATSTRCAAYFDGPRRRSRPSRAARRWPLNPLRVLDSKRPQDAEVIAGAPIMLDHLSPASAAHFERVQRGPDAARHRLRDRASARARPRLLHPHHVRVRRPTRSTAPRTPSAAAVATTGSSSSSAARPARPASGFGAGIERILLACDAEGVFGAPAATVDVFVVDAAGGDAALVLADELRRAGVRADRAFDGRSMKAQMKAADRSGAAVAAHRRCRRGRRRRGHRARRCGATMASRCGCLATVVDYVKERQ